MKRQPGALTLSEDDRLALALWAADCAERSLFEARAPSGTRPRDAIDGHPVFACGDMRIGGWPSGGGGRAGSAGLTRHTSGSTCA